MGRVSNLAHRALRHAISLVNTTSCPPARSRYGRKFEVLEFRFLAISNDYVRQFSLSMPFAGMSQGEAGLVSAGDNDFDATTLEFGAIFVGDAVVGNECMHHFYPPERREGNAANLR